MDLKNSETYQNLARAFAGECQAQNRYKFIEYGARKEGYSCLAEVIDKIVYNEFNHERMFYTEIQKASKETIDNIDYCLGTPFREKWDLTENLRLAAMDEFEETKIYPDFAKTAFDEGFERVGKLFTNIAEIEKCHNMLFTDLYEQMSSGTLYKKDKEVKWKCSACGYEHTANSAPEVCPVCLAKQGVFLLQLKDN